MENEGVALEANSEGDINNRMKIVRIEKDITQQELADAIDVIRQTMDLIKTLKYNP